MRKFTAWKSDVPLGLNRQAFLECFSPGEHTHDNIWDVDYWRVPVGRKHVKVYDWDGVLYINEVGEKQKKYVIDKTTTCASTPQKEVTKSMEYHKHIVESFGYEYFDKLKDFDKVYIYESKLRVLIYKDGEQVKTVYKDGESMYIHSSVSKTFFRDVTVSKEQLTSNEMSRFEYKNQPLYKTWEWSSIIQRVDDGAYEELSDMISKLNIEENTSTNESMGITAEYLLCKYLNIKFDINEKRLIKDKEALKMLSDLIVHFPKTKFYDYKWIGSDNMEADFTMKDVETKDVVTLSLKTTYSNSRKLCPQNIGQVTSLDKLRRYMPVPSSIKEFNSEEFREYVMENIEYIISVYVKNLFVCDYMFYVDIYNNETYFIEESVIKKRLLQLKKDKFTFTQTKETWKESNTVKYNGVSIGEFQLHVHRKCFKFRFIFNGLNELGWL
jgi:hypothetical protein